VQLPGRPGRADAASYAIKIIKKYKNESGKLNKQTAPPCDEAVRKELKKSWQMLRDASWL